MAEDPRAPGFRRGVRTAMQLAKLSDPDLQPAFYFNQPSTSTSSVDAAGVPFDPNVSNTTPATGPVYVDCAVEYFDAENQPTNFGLLAPSRIVVTVLDEEYAKIKGCDYVVIHGDRYNYRRTEPPTGLFDVGVFSLHFMAESET